jgi:hypothetical protein
VNSDAVGEAKRGEKWGGGGDLLAEEGGHGSRQRHLIERGGGWDLSESRMNERYQRRGSILPQSERAKVIRMTKPSDNAGEVAK